MGTLAGKIITQLLEKIFKNKWGNMKKIPLINFQ